MQEADRLFDIGVVDANSDGLLDVYTSNHHFRQALLLADGKGGYRDVVSDWGLDQSREFARAELSFVGPEIREPGLYIYWFGTQLLIQAHKLSDPARWAGTMRVNDPVEIARNEGFAIQKRDQATISDETVVSFTPAENGVLRMKPGGQGLPVTFEFGSAPSLGQIFVGRGKASPRQNRFALAMQDRHGLAWADFNGDGVLDVFISRGALAGTLRAHTDAINRLVKDELFLSEGAGRFQEVGEALGIRKRGCSGRHVRWLDVDNDGLMDLFVNCYDRGRVEGGYPKQLYRQNRDGSFTDVADEVGLGLPQHQISNFAWFDVEGDGDTDLLAFEDDGFYLYRNQNRRFARETVHPRTVDPAARIGRADDRAWFYDGKMTVGDFDNDGDLDVFSASRRGNLLLVNERGRLSVVELPSLSLPPRSIAATWVDFDNDGLLDLHLVPNGLFRQVEGGKFAPTGWFEYAPDEFSAAIVNWFDRDNDGRMDVLMALLPDAAYKPWWRFSEKRSGPPGRWTIGGFRNESRAGHWLQVNLDGALGNRQGVGARVTVVSGARRQVGVVGATEGSYFSQGHYRLYFGLGSVVPVDRVEVGWPDGGRDSFANVGADRVLDLRRSNQAPSAFANREARK
jgi:hypothetical protein